LPLVIGVQGQVIWAKMA